MSEKLTAVQAMMRRDLRKLRADAVAYEILKAIRPYLADDRDADRDACRAIQSLLFDKGVEVLTDYDREQMGLPARGPDGWTAQEIAALELKRLELLMKPLNLPVFPIPKPPPAS